MARTTVASRRGVLIVAIGRAEATTRSASAARNSANGTWRRQLAPPRRAARDEALRGEGGRPSRRGAAATDT